MSNFAELYSHLFSHGKTVMGVKMIRKEQNFFSSKIINEKYKSKNEEIRGEVTE